MAGNRKFHNKFHSANHHTLPSPHIVDSGLDPIASHDFPFMGDFVISGLVSASNEYILNGPRSDRSNLDTIPWGMPAPVGWNVFRDSTYIDGDVTITGNLSAFGELTYLHTQVYTTSATEIVVVADNSNGKTAALHVDQYGSNDLVDIRNDGKSTLLITGSAGDSDLLGGWLGINLGNLPDVDRPNQRMTIVGSVSVVGDPEDSTSDYQQTSQADPGVTGSLYIEGGLHVNDTSYVDQLIVDTTDGNMIVSGDGLIYVNTPVDIDNVVDIDEHTFLDQLTVDTFDGEMVVSGSHEVRISTSAGVNIDTILDVDEHTQLDQLTVDTDDGRMLVQGDQELLINTIGGVNIDTTLDVDGHTQLDQLTVDTTEGEFKIIGAGGMNIDTTIDIDAHTQVDQLTVDTTDGKMYITGDKGLHVDSSGEFLIDSNLIVRKPTEVDKLTVDTTDGQMSVTGTERLYVATTNGVDFEGNFTSTGTSIFYNNTKLDTSNNGGLQGSVEVIGEGGLYIANDLGAEITNNLNVNGETYLRGTSIDTNTFEGTDAEFIVTGDGAMIVGAPSFFNQNITLSGTATAYDMIVDTSLNGSTFKGTGDVNFTEDTNVYIDNKLTLGTLSVEGSATFEDEVQFDGITSFYKDIQTYSNISINLEHSEEFLVTGVGLIKFGTDVGDNRLAINSTTNIYGKTTIHNGLDITSTLNDSFNIVGTGGVVFETDQPVNFISDVSLNNVSANISDIGTLVVHETTNLNKTTIDTQDGNLLVHGSGGIVINANTDFTGSSTILGNTDVETSAASNFNINGGGTFNVDAATNFTQSALFTNSVEIDTTYGGFHVTSPDLDDWQNLDFANIFNVSAPTVFESLTANSRYLPIIFNGDNKTIFNTPVQFTNETPIQAVDVVVDGTLEANAASLHNVVINTNGSEFQIVGNNRSIFNTDAYFSNNVHIAGDLRVDGNAYLSAGAGGIINVGDSDNDTVIFKSEIGSDIVPDSDSLFSLGNNFARWFNAWVVSINATEIDAVNINTNGLTATGDSKLTNTHIGGQLTLEQGFTTDGSVDIGGTLNVSDGIDTDGDLHVAGSQTISQSLSVTQPSRFQSDLQIDGDLHVDGDVFFNLIGNDGSVVIGNDLTDTISLVGDISGNFIPTITDSFDLGSVTNKWKYLYSVDIDTYDLTVHNSGFVAGTLSIGDQLYVADEGTFANGASINTGSRGFTVNGSSQGAAFNVPNVLIHSYTFDVSAHTYLDQLTIDTTEGGVYIHGGDNDSTSNILDVDVPTELDQLSVDTTDGPMTVSGENDLNITTNVNIVGQLSAVNGPWVFDSCDFLGYNPGAVNPVDQSDGTVENVTYTQMPFHPFRVECNALFNSGLTAHGPVQIGELPNEIVDELPEPTFEVLGNMHLAQGNLKIESDIRHLHDENTYLRFIPDGITLAAGGGDLLKLVENTNSNNHVEIGSFDAAADVTFYLQDGTGPGLEFDSSTGDLSVAGDLVVSGAMNSTFTTLNTDTISAKTLVVDYLTVYEGSYGNVGGGHGSGSSAMSTLSGIARKDEVTNHWVLGNNQSFQGSELGVVYDVSTQDQEYMQNFWSITFEALEDNVTLGIQQGDIQTLNYHFVSKWDDFYSEAFVNEVESGIVYTSSNPFANVTSVVLSATEVPTTERIVKLIARTEVDAKFWINNVLVQDKPQRLQTVTTSDFDVDGNLTVVGDQIHQGNSTVHGTLSATSGVAVSGNVSLENDLHVKGDLYVDGNAYLSAGADGIINVGDTDLDSVIFNSEIASNLQPSQNMSFDLGSVDKHWMNIYTHNVSAHGDVYWDGGSSTQLNSTHASVLATSADWDSTHASVLATSSNWDSTHASMLATSGDWDSTHTSVLNTSADWNSTHASVNTTSGDWDSTHTSVLNTSADWNSTHASVNTTSGDWNSTHASVLATSSDWDSTHASVNTTSGDWNSTHTSVLNTSSDWDSTHASVLATSSDWDGAHTFVSSDSATNNTDYNRTNYVNTSGDIITGDLDITGHLSGTTAVFTSITALSSVVDVIDIKVRELSGYDIIDGDLTVGGHISASGDVYLNEHSLIFSDGETFSSIDSINTKSTHVSVLNTSGDWNSTHASVLATSGDWNSTHASVLATSGDWNSTHASVLATSSDWDSTHASVLATSSDWNSTHASVLATSSNWDSTHASVLATSSDWNSTHASVLATSSNWDSTHASVLATSAYWDSTHASVLATSSDWDSVYNLVNNTSGEGFANLEFDDVSQKLVLKDDQVPRLAITHVDRVENPSLVSNLTNIKRGDFVIVTATQENLIAIIDDPDGTYYPNIDEYNGYEKLFAPGNIVQFVNGYQGPSITLDSDDINDFHGSHKFVSQEQIDNWKSTNTSVSSTSGDWDSVYSWVNGDSATNNTNYNNTTFVNTSGDTISGDLAVVGHLSGTTAVFTSITALSSVVDVIDIKVRELSGYDIIDGDLRVDGSISTDGDIIISDEHVSIEDVLRFKSTHTSVHNTSGDWDSTHASVNTTSADWNSTHTSVHNTSGDWNSTHASVNTTSADWNSTHASVLATSSDWNSTHTSVLNTSADWNSTHASVLATSSDWDSTHASVNTTSADWDSTHASVLATSSNWDNTHASVLATSSDWDSTHVSVNTTSADWNSTHVSVNTTSADWDSTHASVLATSSDWNSTHTSVLATSSDWDGAYTFVNSDSATNNTNYNNTTFVNTSGDTISGDLNITGHLAGTTAVFTSITALSSVVDVIDIKVRELSGYDIIDGDLTVGGHISASGDVYLNEHSLIFSDGETFSSIDSVNTKSTHASVLATSADWNSTHASVLATSADWNSAHASVLATSADWNSTHASVLATSSDWDSTHTSVVATSSNWDSTHASVLNTSGDWNSVHASVLATSADWNSTHASVLATSSNWDSTHASVLATSADWDSTHTSVLNTSSDWDSTHASVLATSSDWDSTHTSVLNTSSDWDSTHASVLAISSDWDSTHTSVLNTSGDWNSVYNFVKDTSGSGDGFAVLDNNGKLLESQIPNLSITDVHAVGNATQVEQLCNGLLHGDVDIQRGDVVIVTSPPHTLIAAVDQPTGTWTDNSGDPGNTDTFDGFVKITTPTDYIFSVNGKNGSQIILNPDDIDDTSTQHKFVSQYDINKWNSTHTSVFGNSSNWYSTHTSVLNTSGDWNSTHASVLATSGDWNSTHASVLNTSGDWNSTHASVLATSSEWDSTHASVLNTSGDWSSTHASVNATSADWNDVYSWINSDSATNNTDYNNTTFVNTSGDTIDGSLNITGTTSGDAAIYTSLTALSAVVDVIDVTSSLNVSGSTQLGATSGSSLDLRGSLISNINLSGDNIYSIGSSDSRLNAIYTYGLDVVDSVDIAGGLSVNDTTVLSGKNANGPGLVIDGTPTGIFDINDPGFLDRDGDYMLPDVDVTGDVAIHGSLSADSAHIYSLTASNFRAEYQKLVVNDGDLDVYNGNIRQRGGNMLVESDIAHIDDENTYIRFQQDQLKFVCHDVQMIQMYEYPTQDNVIVFGDTHAPVNIQIQNPVDENTLFIDAETARIGIGTSSPQTRLHIESGQVQLAAGDQDGALMIPAGDSSTRVEKAGSIRYNSDLNRYEGFLNDTDEWTSFEGLGDTDGDTYIDCDSEATEDFNDTDRMSFFTAGCSAMTIYPDSTVAFAGDIRFDNITVYDSDSMTGPISATSEFIYLKVNGKDRAIRLWSTPSDTRGDLQTIHGENIIQIGDECGSGISGDIPMQSISAESILSNPPTQSI